KGNGGESSEARLRRELAESRAREAATAAILRVIARSRGDAQPVFDAIVKNALRLIHGHSAAVALVDGEMLCLAALTSTGKSGDKNLRESFPRPLKKSGQLSRAVRLRRPCWIEDTEKVSAIHPTTTRLGRARGYRSNLVVPLLRGGAAIGTLA